MASEFLSLLMQSDILSALTEDQLMELSEHIEVKQYAANEVIVEEGDPGDGMFVVSTGTAAVSTQSHDGISRVVLAMLGPGQSFGEMALLDQQPRSATVVALGPTTCLYLPAAQFRALLQRHASMSQALLPVLVQRLRDADRWIQALLRSSRRLNI
ncbi:MAG: cyclic nucleotide-binding domain-containing protein [Chloroflexi bacterium]|nr:cyclic nucleotide-binding domain-containing protein [Chloroflexota bacterium]